MTITSSGRHREGSEPHWVEWATGILSAMLVLGLIGWIGFEAVMRETSPPALSIRTLSTRNEQAGYRVDFEVANEATTTAAAVVVRGEILENGKPVEEADIAFDYVPAQSSTKGTLIFATDPNGREIRIRPVGFTDP